MVIQEPLPSRYRQLDPERMMELADQRKRQLGRDVCILGHHYQGDAVIRFADFTGDSLKLSQIAAAQKAKYIVFCGVHFMAESADVLSSSDQTVILPNLRAGCTMADMADDVDVAAALEEVQAAAGRKVVPVTYVNSSAKVKAVTARFGGACCTSSNVRNVFRWALAAESQGGAGAEKIFAIPDEHLARNTAMAMGYSADDCAVYDPRQERGGLTREQISRATFILWKGNCYVHQLFRPEHVDQVRERHPEIKVIVHPECPHEVVRRSDAAGSTEQIIKAVSSATAGAQWAIGTESNLVHRLAKQHKDQFIRVLSDAPAFCAQMQRIDLPHLLWALDNLAEGRVVNSVRVEPSAAEGARVALERMISIKAVQEVTPTIGD